MSYHEHVMKLSICIFISFDMELQLLLLFLQELFQGMHYSAHTQIFSRQFLTPQLLTVLFQVSFFLCF